MLVKDQIIQNTPYLHKIHLFILSHLSLFLCGLYNISQACTQGGSVGSEEPPF